MSRLWSSGFEFAWDGIVSKEFSYITDGIVIDTTNPRSGANSLKIATLASATPTYTAYQFLASGTTTNRYYRAYLYVTTRPSAANRIMVFNNANSGTSSPSVYLTMDNNGVLKLFDEDGQITGTATLNTGQWYNIEVHIDTTPAGGSHVVEARVDGAAAFASASDRNIDSANTPFWWLMGGNLAAEAQTTGLWYFDDLAINDTSGSGQTSWAGEGKIIFMSVDSDGDNTAWTASAGADYTTVDEAEPNTTDYVGSSNPTDLEDFNLAATPAEVSSGDTINCVQVGVYFRKGGGGGTNPTFKLRIKKASGGTVTESANITPTDVAFTTNSHSAPKDYQLTLYNNPDGGAWTKATLDTAQVGLNLVASPNGLSVDVSKIWLLVDHTAATTTTTTTSTSTSTSTTSTSTSTSSSSSTSSSTSTSTTNTSSSSSSSTTTTNTSSSTSSTTSSTSTSSTTSTVTSSSTTSSSTSTSTTSSSTSTSSSSTSSSTSTSSTSSSTSTSSSSSSTSSSTSTSSSSTSTSSTTSSTSSSTSTSSSSTSTSTSTSTSSSTSTSTSSTTTFWPTVYSRGDIERLRPQLY